MRQRSPKARSTDPASLVPSPRARLRFHSLLPSCHRQFGPRFSSYASSIPFFLRSNPGVQWTRVAPRRSPLTPTVRPVDQMSRLRPAQWHYPDPVVLRPRQRVRIRGRVVVPPHLATRAPVTGLLAGSRVSTAPVRSVSSAPSQPLPRRSGSQRRAGAFRPSRLCARALPASPSRSLPPSIPPRARGYPIPHTHRALPLIPVAQLQAPSLRP